MLCENIRDKKPCKVSGTLVGEKQHQTVETGDRDRQSLNYSEKIQEFIEQHNPVWDKNKNNC